MTDRLKVVHARTGCIVGYLHLEIPDHIGTVQFQMIPDLADLARTSPMQEPLPKIITCALERDKAGRATAAKVMAGWWSRAKLIHLPRMPLNLANFDDVLARAARPGCIGHINIWCGPGNEDFIMSIGQHKPGAAVIILPSGLLPNPDTWALCVAQSADTMGEIFVVGA